MTAQLLPFPSRMVDGRAFEPHISGKELADRLSVSIRTVERWQSEGMPSEKFGRARRYQHQRCVEWLRGRSVRDTETG